jgi:hypothetical protein
VALAALLAVVVGSPAAVGAVLFAALAVLERWGTASLGAVAGAQSVLGPGGVVGPASAAASAWLAAAALVLASPSSGGDRADPSAGDPGAGPSRRRRFGPAPAALVIALATGPAAAAAVAGPQYVTGLGLRLGATAAAVALAALVASLRWEQVTAVLALALGVAATVLGASVVLGRVGA